ncbi:MAG TPA: 4-alpha-glucanotransferase [Candidatus Xenobia bacterium]|nr:4-alpha-glucanotransferase [Candidatus Xenobia bacterium]
MKIAIRFEHGGGKRWVASLDDLPVRWREEVDGVGYVARGLRLPPLPLGYHRLRVELGGEQSDALVIAAPTKAYAPPGKRRCWSVFLPLYALHTEGSWGAGDFSDLKRFAAWAGRQGSCLLGTLPLLPAFLNELFEPSPYSPVSRLFWSEFYLDVTQAPELVQCPSAQRRLNSAQFRRALEQLHREPLVDYRRGMALKREILEGLAQTFFSRRGGPPPEFCRFLKTTPQLEDYTRFRATTELRRRPWSQWPARLRGGDLRPGDYEESDRRYHLYVQWLANRQMKRLAAHARRYGAGLNLDLPIGTHSEGYDVWREQRAFALGTCVGAPADRVWTQGQNWGFPPLHPERIREHGYRYLIACLRHQMRYADLVRIDHVAGLHRLFWIPAGVPAGEGAYVHYRAEEVYALLCLESHRQHAAVVGENLGVVPPYVNSTMSRHGILKMFVVQYEVEGGVQRALKRVPADALASLNTHDMPPFAGWWEGRDIADRCALGLMSPAAARAQHQARLRRRVLMARILRRTGWLKGKATDSSSVFRACAEFLAASRAGAILLNLEDLWGETEPQNIPGTSSRERPNWRRKARYSLEEFTRLPVVSSILDSVRRLRQRTG